MSSRDKEKYYWWKKDKNYYSDHRIKSLKKEKNGYVYLTLLDQIKCESTPYNGTLRYSKARAFTDEELSATLDIPVKMVKAGLEVLKEKELIKTLGDGTIKVLEFENCVGFETGAAKRMKGYRERTKQERNGNETGTKREQTCPESRVKSQDIRDIDDDEIIKCARTWKMAGGTDEIIQKATEYLRATKSPSSMFYAVVMAIESGQNWVYEALDKMSQNECTDEETFQKVIETLGNDKIHDKEAYIATIFKNQKAKEMRS